MNNDAIKRVSEAIADRIEAAFPTGSPLKVIVAPPNKDNLGAIQIVLFPYRLMVNTELRNTERVLPPVDPNGVPRVYDNALPLDIFYLMTAGTAEGGDLDSLAMFGMAIQALHQDPVLSGSPVDGDVVRISLEPASLDEMSRVWTMFPDADYRTSVVYVASPVWIDPLSVDVAAPVIDQQSRFGQASGSSLQ
jgi:hypothetical protein